MMGFKLQMSLIAMFLMWYIFIPLSIQSDSAVFKICLKDQVIVAKQQVELKDIAEISGLSADSLVQVGSIIIATSPLPMHKRRLSKGTIKNKLFQNGWNIADFAFSGAETVEIKTSSTQLDPEKITHFVRDYLEEILPYPPENREIHFLQQPRQIIVPDYDLHFQVHHRDLGILKDRLVISVGIYNGDNPYQTISIPVRVRTFEEVVVAKELIKKHELITLDNVKLIRTETTTHGEGFFYSLDDILQKRAVRLIKAGHIIKNNYVESSPHVYKGDIITIRSELGLVSVSMLGFSLEDGYIGECIKVKSKGSGEVLIAKIRDKDTVIVP